VRSATAEHSKRLVTRSVIVKHKADPVTAARAVLVRQDRDGGADRGVAAVVEHALTEVIVTLEAAIALDP
jgi:hypothetical protein